ncbi:Tissue factor pathway inhibitor [Schistosoma japonicum]|nr:Tissue factor pathway inhibitor [Schistosoma japonicum]
MKIRQITLITNLFFLLFIHSAEGYAVLEGKRIVKKVYSKRQPIVLSAASNSISTVDSTTGLSNSSNNNNIDHTTFNKINSFSTVHHIPKNTTGEYIPPNFITGAHLVPAHSIFSDANKENYAQWSFSTTYNPSTSSEVNNVITEDIPSNFLMYKQSNQPEEEIHSFGGGNQQRNIENDNDLSQIHSDYLYDNDYDLPEEMRKYQVVISSDMDLPYSMDQPNEATFSASKSPWSYNKVYHQPMENEFQFKQNMYPDVLQQKEEARPVYHSPIRWAVRSINTVGQPRHIACSQPLDTGVGSDELSSWYYDSNSGKCRWFGYRGNGGNANRFYSRTACEELCVRDNQNLCEFAKCPKPVTSCELIRVESCKMYKQQYSKSWEAECPPDQPVCVTKRNTRRAPDIDFENVPSECRQSPDPGSCQIKNPSQHFFYDIESNDCKSFYFHECGGNDNRFVTKSDCMSHCSP